MRPCWGTEPALTSAVTRVDILLGLERMLLPLATPGIVVDVTLVGDDCGLLLGLGTAASARGLRSCVVSLDAPRHAAPGSELRCAGMPPLAFDVTGEGAVTQLAGASGPVTEEELRSLRSRFDLVLVEGETSVPHTNVLALTPYGWEEGLDLGAFSHLVTVGEVLLPLGVEHVRLSDPAWALPPALDGEYERLLGRLVGTHRPSPALGEAEALPACTRSIRQETGEAVEALLQNVAWPPGLDGRTDAGGLSSWVFTRVGSAAQDVFVRLLRDSGNVDPGTVIPLAELARCAVA